MGSEFRRFGNWLSRKTLGQGGQGTVLLVRSLPPDKLGEIDQRLTDCLRPHVNPDRELPSLVLLDALELFENSKVGALKLIHSEATAKNPASFLKRFERELAVLSTAKHPNLIRILDSNPKDRWFVMEYHGNGTLTDHLAKFAGQPMAAIRAFRPLVEAVAELHSTGPIVHRDIKPDNILCGTDGRLILGDFGLVIDAENSTRLTNTLENAGSRDWMPPWAHGARLEEVPPAFDTFSLGKVFWAMLSGKPFLRLHYYNDEDFDLARMFPHETWPTRVNEFLGKCVTDRAKDGMERGSVMLGELEKLEKQIKGEAEPGSIPAVQPTTGQRHGRENSFSDLARNIIIAASHQEKGFIWTIANNGEFVVKTSDRTLSGSPSGKDAAIAEDTVEQLIKQGIFRRRNEAVIQLTSNGWDVAETLTSVED